MKSILFFLQLFILGLFISCSVENSVSVDQIKTDIMGATIAGSYGTWVFESPDEILDVKINSQTRTEDILKVDTEFILEGMSSKKIFYLHSLLEYKLINREWKFIAGEQLKYLKDYESKSFQD